MRAVFVSTPSPDDPLSVLEVGERPEPEAPDDWTTVQVKAVSLNHHDLFSLQGIGLPAERMPMILGTDVTGFGLLGHLYKMARASGVTAVVDAAAVPYLAGARAALAAGFVSGGTRRNLDWVRPHADLSAVSEDEALLLADAQTSGGLLLAGEVPGAPVVGEFVPRQDAVVVVR